MEEDKVIVGKKRKRRRYKKRMREMKGFKEDYKKEGDKIV